VSKAEEVSVTLGDGVAVIRRKGTSACIVAGVLGLDTDAGGATETVYLDRLVHRVGETDFEGWKVSGAVSTILRRR
jgi:hypothetical protein